MPAGYEPYHYAWWRYPQIQLPPDIELFEKHLNELREHLQKQKTLPTTLTLHEILKETPMTTTTQPKSVQNLANTVLNATAPQTPPAIQVTHVAFVLDSSGSMDLHRNGLVNAYNQMLDALRTEAEGQRINVSRYRFDWSVYQESFEAEVSVASRLTGWRAGGGTALRAGIYKAVTDLECLPDANDPNVSFLVVVITDGEENSSGRVISRERLVEIISQKQATDRWTFAVSCPQGHTGQVTYHLGIPEGNIQEWDTTSETGMRDVGVVNTNSITNYAASRKTGTRSTKDYFKKTINIGHESQTKLVSNLTAEPKSRFRRMTVPKACTVKELVIAKKKKWDTGRVFYPLLQRQENVQDYKEIVLEQKTNPGVYYSGQQVRDLLGIPQGQDAKLKPGNLGGFNIFIQSTSDNRNLIAGMEVLYDQNPSPSTTQQTHVTPEDATKTSGNGA